MEEAVRAAPDRQVSLTDPDARSTATSSTGTSTGTIGYNVQAAVDAERHLIVAHEITNPATAAASSPASPDRRRRLRGRMRSPPSPTGATTRAGTSWSAGRPA
jgi:hypothetical protein